MDIAIDSHPTDLGETDCCVLLEVCIVSVLEMESGLNVAEATQPTLLRRLRRTIRPAQIHESYIDCRFTSPRSQRTGALT